MNSQWCKLAVILLLLIQLITGLEMFGYQRSDKDGENKAAPPPGIKQHPFNAGLWNKVPVASLGDNDEKVYFQSYYFY